MWADDIAIGYVWSIKHISTVIKKKKNVLCICAFVKNNFPELWHDQFVFSLLNDRISTTSTIVSNFLHSNVIKISSDFISRWTLCLLKSLGQFLRFHWKSLCYDCFWKLSWVPYMWTSPNRVICYHMGESWSKSINLGNLRWKVKVIQTCFIF